MLLVKNLLQVIDGLEYLPDRIPEQAFSGGAEKAFAELAKYRDGAVYVGFYSGSSEWERHASGDEIVLVLAGSTSLIVVQDEKAVPVKLSANDFFIVPCNTWHRFENSEKLQVMTVTPQPTDHSLERPLA